jgi:sigma-B regulation protein RsbU (phosphoserine phosphatase)
MGNPDMESSPWQNTEGKTIRCDDQTDCQIKLVDTGRAGRFINLGQHLKEHRRMSHSLNLAKEVQQSLLPRTTPQFAGLDIAGKSMYCDETGGDYFDYHELNEKKHKKLGVAIGDVSGHGISAALLMATVRAALRQRVCLGGSLKDIISDVNRQLASDVEDSGQFMGLFYLVVDPTNRNVKWVRAGHPPAILYDLETDLYEELNGSGLVLGVDPGQKYAENEKRSLKNSQIIVLATDGILEARNSAGDMFGKESIVNVIRQNKAFTAKQILNAVFDNLQRFRHKAQLEDDMTLVVIKLVR